MRGMGGTFTRITGSWVAAPFGPYKIPALTSHRTVAGPATHNISADNDVGEVTRANAAAGSVQINLPPSTSVSWGAPVGYNRSMDVWIQRVDDTATTVVTIFPDGVETINGAASLILTGLSSVHLYSDGTTWYVMSLWGDVKSADPPYCDRVITDTATGTQNAWTLPASASVAGYAGPTTVFWSGASLITVNGILSGSTGQRLLIKNTGSALALFAHANGSAAAADRLTNLATSAPTPVAPGGWIAYEHNGTNWKLIGHEQGAAITPTFAAGTYTADTASWTLASGDVTTQTYVLRGKWLTVVWALNTTTVARAGADPTFLYISNAAWGGFTATTQVQTVGGYAKDNNGANEVLLILVFAAGTQLFLGLLDLTQWANATDLTSVYGQTTFEVD